MASRTEERWTSCGMVACILSKIDPAITVHEVHNYLWKWLKLKDRLSTLLVTQDVGPVTGTLMWEQLQSDRKAKLAAELVKKPERERPTHIRGKINVALWFIDMYDSVEEAMSFAKIAADAKAQEERQRATVTVS